MINFLDPIFNPKVACNENCTDNYEIENLISNSFLVKSRGFLAYTTVKPPVDIDFELICPISIDYILINSTVGNHMCSGIEIMVKNVDEYISVGKSIYDANGVVFCSSKQYSQTNLPGNIPINYNTYFLNRYHSISDHAKCFRIRIFRTNKSVPCLGSVEIWGKVSNICSTVTKNTIHTLFKKSQYNINTTLMSQSSSAIENSVVSEERTDIPDDFKDSLTFEIMSIPMTLPSGKTIDQITLQKHIEFEEKHGRNAGDPFTGIKFTKTMKPVLNVALKSRIDMYLLQHSSNPKFSILGRSTESTAGINENEEKVTNTVKRIKMDDDEIFIDNSKSQFKKFSDETVKCCLICESQQILYILPCKHCCCRKCLHELCEVLKCNKCSIDFKKSDVERFHVLS